MLTIEVEGGFLETMKYVGEWVRESDELWFPLFQSQLGSIRLSAVLVFRVSYRQRCESLMSCSFYVLVTTVSWEAAVLRPTKFGLHNEMLTRLPVVMWILFDC
jgi:hypothetical protein